MESVDSTASRFMDGRMRLVEEKKQLKNWRPDAKKYYPDINSNLSAKETLDIWIMEAPKHVVWSTFCAIL